MLGPMLPMLSQRWQLSDLNAGYFFTAQFFASLITAAASGIFISRFTYRGALFCSLILMGVGAAMLDHGSWQLGMTAVCIYGAGFGLSSPTANLLIAELNPERRAAALNLVNFSWGIGAVGAPIAFAFLQRSGRELWFTYAITAIAMVLAICVALTKFNIASKSQSVPNKPAKKIDANRAVHLGFILCMLFFTYVGTESAIGGWVATHAHRLSFGIGSFWMLTPSIYWGSLLLGRALAPLILLVVEEIWVARAGLLLALAGMIFILSAHSVAAVATGAGLAGLGLASIFPANLSLLAQWFGSRAPAAGAFAFPAASLGGAILPWLVGVFSSYSGGLHRGMEVPLVGVALMLLLYVTHGHAKPAEAA